MRGDFYMETIRKQLAKDKYLLKKIEKNLKSTKGISIISIFHDSNIYANYSDFLNEICKINFPILLTQERGYKKYEYIEYLYKHLNISIQSFKWLIPYFDGSNWWIELQIDNLEEFVKFYFHNKKLNLTAIDTKNKLLFDIEYGESNFEYRVMWL